MTKTLDTARATLAAALAEGEAMIRRAPDWAQGVVEADDEHRPQEAAHLAAAAGSTVAEARRLCWWEAADRAALHALLAPEREAVEAAEAAAKAGR
jgi:hypothetical protein